MIVVKLDNPKHGAGPATVIAIVETVYEYLQMSVDRDGARKQDIRLWRGNFPVGSSVALSDE